MSTEASAEKYNLVRQDIIKVFPKEDYDDGSFAPIVLRLAWHSSGTYDKHKKNGGSDGATMRFKTEAEDPANNGLNVARDLLEPIKAKHAWISYADLWTLAGCVAIEHMGGPHIPWTGGRRDKHSVEDCPPQGRLPDGALGKDHVLDLFVERMGFSVQETVALMGAHTVGRCHRERSGFEGPWTPTPTRFSNQFYKQLLAQTWVEKQWDGNRQFVDAEDGELMMLPTDIAMLEEPFRPYVELYAKDKQKFFDDFSVAFLKLIELGVAKRGKL
ncbi:heme peroxidase [Apophysomyces ossiformis]|uniref:Peroxidase n=1 Tax=Apophysomyces ossiformis TaxID=679940 RepID=A0A8H7BJV8_9FUNG|nr:heme peroxidase [Apophysomyces ossiformis]